MPATSEPVVPPMTRWLRHAQLAFLGFFFIRFLFPPIAWWEYVVNGIGLSLFLYFYFQADRMHCRENVWPIVGTVLAGVLVTPINSGANVFFIFAAYYLGRFQPARRARTGIAGILALVVVLGLTVNPSWNFWLPAVIVIIGMGGLAMRDRREAMMRRALATSQEEIRRLAEEAERERIARDLHDTVGHTLSLITLKSELAGRLVTRDADAATRELKEIESISREALAEIRETVQGYRKIDLAQEIDALEAALGTSGVRLEREITAPPLDPRTETAVALVIREAVTNIIRHARASVCRIALRRDGDNVLLSVTDDGRGSDGEEGFGVRGMRARISGLGGQLSTSDDGGTIVAARWPTEF